MANQSSRVWEGRNRRSSRRCRMENASFQQDAKAQGGESTLGRCTRYSFNSTSPYRRRCRYQHRFDGVYIRAHTCTARKCVGVAPTHRVRAERKKIYTTFGLRAHKTACGEDRCLHAYTRVYVCVIDCLFARWYRAGGFGRRASSRGFFEFLSLRWILEAVSSNIYFDIFIRFLFLFLFFF